MRNQGSTGWCYYFSAADVLCAATGKNISPSYLGSLIAPSGEGGSGATSLNEVTQRFGLCTETTMPSRELSPEFRSELGSLDERAKLLKAAGEPLDCLLTENLLGKGMNQNLARLTEAISRALDDSGRIQDLRIPKFIGKKGSVEFAPASVAQHLALARCEDDRRSFGSASVRLKAIDHHVPRAQMFEALDRTLDRHAPVAVGYNVDALVAGRKSMVGNHWSTIVGRKYVDGECKYLLRNSWGASWCPSGRTCEPPGHLWVSGIDLFRTMDEVEYVE